ncbi:MAG: epoxyqueuosine reductase QueH [Lachnospiraceae bacterium]|nr:epoxyqueuosine reductase QueH [Lachnospiraceae bacterium]
MNRRNYQKELDAIIKENENRSRVPRLFLHSCCAPCSSYVLEYLAQYFEITVFYYNPNISPEEEYKKRIQEQQRLIRELSKSCRTAGDPGTQQEGGIRFYPIRLETGPYEPQRFYGMAKGLEQEPEGGERCYRCYRLRMEETARLAAEGGFDYFTTTLSISPLKNAVWLNEIGEELEAVYPVKHLPSDFKKRNGYRRSVELSQKHRLYRQNYCGCVFSKTGHTP